MSQITNAAEEIARAETVRDEKMSELAVLRSRRAQLVEETAVTLPQDVWRRKNARMRQLGQQEQAIVTELSMLKNRIRTLRNRSSGDAVEQTGKERQAAIAKWFMQVAFDVLDPAVFGQIQDAALLRAQLPAERQSQPGDGRTFANAQWSRGGRV